MHKLEADHAIGFVAANSLQIITLTEASSAKLAITFVLVPFVFSYITEVMDEVAQNVPTLEKIVSEIEGLAESGGKYMEAPHVIEVTLPMLCRYD